MNVFFTPDKKRWQFWKKSKFLKEGKDFSVKDSTLTLSKSRKGRLVVTYNYES